MVFVKTRRENLLDCRRGLIESLRIVDRQLYALESDEFLELALNVLAGITAYHANTKGDLDNGVGWDIRNEFQEQLRQSLKTWYEREGN